MIKKISNVNIVNHNSIIFGDIYIENNKIKKIIKKSNSENKNKDYCIPGFIDQHTHGAYGISFDSINLIDDEKINLLINKLEEEGVCGIFLTTVTQDFNKIIEIGKYLNNKNKIIIGWHLEGPFLNKVKKGAHDERYIIEISNTLISKIQKTNNLKKIITVAPEIKNALKVIEDKKDSKTFFSIGHSNASYEITKNAVEKGCTQFTHLYNAMSGFDHRNPGIVNFALNDKKSYIELITDGVHIDNNVLIETYKIFSSDKIIIVSDSLSPKGLKNGNYHLGSLEIEKKGDQCYLYKSNTLAGSTMKYNDVIKHFFNLIKCNMMDIVKMTSFNTSKQFNLKNYGVIKEGINAKLIICDKNLNIKETIF